MTSPLRVTVWGENFHENSDRDRAGMAERYPEGMHSAIADGLRELLGNAVEVRTATQDEPEHGLTDDVLDSTDVLTWWGHATHAKVDDAVVERVHQRVLGGMGLLVLHSGHFSKIFKRLMGTTCSLAWRNDGEVELVWTVAPAHPIARGVPQPILHRPAGDVRGVLRHPGARRADLHLHLRRRRGVPLRLLLAARQGQGLLLLPGRPGVPRLPPSRHPPGAGQRGRVGPPRPRGGLHATRAWSTEPAPQFTGRVLAAGAAS